MQIDYIISLLLVVFAFIFPKSKFIGFLFFVFMWTLWGWNSWNGDYDAYNKYFQDSFYTVNQVSEFGYYYLNKLLKKLGLEFSSYLKIVSFLVLSVIFWFSKKYCKYIALFSAMYFIIFIMEYVFIRNYLSHSLFFICFFLLIEKPKFYLTSVVLISIMATAIHSTSIIMLPILLLISKNQILDLKKVLLWVGLGLLLSIFFFKAILLPLFGSDLLYKFDYYQTGGGFSNIFFAHLVLVLLVWYFFNSILKLEKGLSEKDKRIMILIVNFNLLTLGYLCLYYHIPYFSRILRFIFALDFIFLLGTLILIKPKYLAKFIIIILLIFAAVMVMFFKSTLSLTFHPLFKKNLIWGEEYYVPDFDYEK